MQTGRTGFGRKLENRTIHLTCCIPKAGLILVCSLCDRCGAVLAAWKIQRHCSDVGLSEVLLVVILRNWEKLDSLQTTQALPNRPTIALEFPGVLHTGSPRVYNEFGI